MTETVPGMSFQDRNDPGGVYAICYEEFSEGGDSLSQLEFKEDFVGETNPWLPDRFATSFHRPSNPDQELVVTLFGEVLDESDGTGLGAKGGLKRTQPNVKDGSKIRDVLALGPPTDANTELANLFKDQMITLRHIVNKLVVPVVPGDKAIPKRVQWFKYKGSTADPSIISVNLPYKYSRPDKSSTPAKLQKRASDKDVSGSKSDQISLTSTYDPQSMSDFDPDLNLQGARLLQQRIFDQDSKLVPPSKAPFVFRKGALVAIEAKLSVFHFVNDPDPSHLYQITASGVKLLAPTPLVYTQPQAVPSSSRRKLAPSRSAMFDKLLETPGEAANKNQNMDV
ncbi:hypothetical protein BJ322DRAFT_673449 [Thelephora terrestris]|uniref:Uncharacterized protein n=1 Tax=Thelephora terrestris TaxID=56493 RepID=A0A9P6HHA9_9AGAM|nr:hypothetical protein BJ322DRAFT_673449 [Thelephora terrestris]